MAKLGILVERVATTTPHGKHLQILKKENQNLVKICLPIHAQDQKTL